MVTPSAYPSDFYPGQVYPSQAPSADRTPSDHLRIEAAFSTSPDDPVPAWVDLTSRANLPAGITITRGRASEFDTVQAGTLTCTLENIDGALSPDNTGSPFYPNVLPQRRIRVTYRDPSNLGQGNMLAAEDASAEGGTVGAWGSGYIGAPASVTLSNSATHPSAGTKGWLIGWPTAAAGCAAVLFTPPLVIGRRYTFRVVVWNAVGTPAVVFGDIFGVMPTVTSTTNGAFETLTFAWVATQTQPVFGVKSSSATTSGQQTWFDAIMIDETPVGTPLGSFTTTAPVIDSRFDGYVNEWPIEWPDGGDTYSRATISASDLLARIDARQKLRSVVVETMALDGPTVHFPLGEANGATLVADIANADPATLPVVQNGAGGTLDFASGTGVPTDGLSAPIFTPAGPNDGLILTGSLPMLNYNGSGDVEMSIALNTTGTNSVACWIGDGWGARLSLEVDGAGKIFARMQIPLNGSNVTTTSAATYNDGQTHHGSASLVTSGGVTTLRLVVDGTATTTTTAGGSVLFTRAGIGGNPTGSLFAGTLSHFAVFPAQLSVARLLEHRLAQTTGFAGERSDQRIARICTWIGLPTARQALDVGNTTTMGHFECTGASPLEYMRKVELTEAGLLFAGADGRLTFYNRARSYSAAAPALTVPVYMLEPTARLAKNLTLVKNDITGSRAGGATVQKVDSASVTANGPLTDQLDILTATDSDLAAAVGWRLYTSKKPLTRFTSLDLDAYTDPTYSPQILAGIDLGARVQITGLPSQAPASTMKQTVQGYTETITNTGWVLQVNATPYDHLIGLITDDATYGVTDSTNVVPY